MTDYVTKPIPAEKPAVDFIGRPWGSFKQFAFNEEVTVSLMTVKGGQRLSLQSHTGRAELWIALDDGCEMQVGEEIHDERKPRFCGLRVARATFFRPFPTQQG